MSKTTTRNRPTSQPAACTCSRCGCAFVGEKWNILCRVCVEMTAREIAMTQTTKWQTCPIGSCSRQQDCMYTPCRAVQAPSKTTEFKAGAEAARHRICAWLRAQANAEYKLRPDGAARAAFVEAHNVILKMDLPEDAESVR